MNAATVDDWFSSLPWIDRPDANIDAYLESLDEDTPFDLRARLQEWQSRGVVVFQDVIPHDLIDSMLNDVEYLKRHYRDFELEVELRGTIKQISEYSPEELELRGIKFNSLQTISKSCALLSLSREVISFLKHVYRSPPVVMQSLTFQKGSEQPVHIDYPYVRCQTKLAHLAASWIPLEDVSPQSGPLAYYPGSHRADISGFFDWGGGSILLETDSAKSTMDLSHYLWDRMRAKGIEPETFCPRKGDVLIWHGNLAHEGTKIHDAEKTRKSYVTHYTSLEAYPEAHMKAGALEDGKFIEAHGGYCFEFPWLTGGPRLPSVIPQQA